MNWFLRWSPVGLGIAFLLCLAWVHRERAFTGKNDFVSFYVAGELSGTSELYSREANEAHIAAILDFTMEHVTYIRAPFYAAFYKPLSWLPYRVAYGLFSLGMLSCIVWFVARFARECDALPVFAAMSLPAVTALCGGQDTPLLLAVTGASLLLQRDKRDFAAGLVLSLLWVKFHLFLFVPLLLISKKRWGMLRGGAAGVGVLVLVGAITAGPAALLEWIGVLRDPWINPDAVIMPNVHGLSAVLGGGLLLEAGLILVVVSVWLWSVCRSENFELLFAVSLVCGLLTSFHCGVSDAIVLLPAFVLVTRHSDFVPARALAALILTPIPYFLSLAGAPWSAVLPLALLVLAGLLGLTLHSRNLSDRRGDQVLPSTTDVHLDGVRPIL